MRLLVILPPLHPRRQVLFRVRLHALLLLAALPTVASAQSARRLFDSSFLPFRTGARPTSVAIGDLDGNGNADLVVGRAEGNTVAVHLGSGRGEFGPRVEYTVGSQPQYVALGDFNGDTALDLAAANTASHTVSVLLGNGDGSFGARNDYASGTWPSSPSYPWGLALGDLDSDGDLDLAVANGAFLQQQASVSVFLGNGDGTLGGKADLATPNFASAVAIADLDTDGRLDLIVTNSAGFSVFRGNGDATFTTRVDFTGAPMAPVAVADLNGDARLDVVLGGDDDPANRSDFAIYLGSGGGSFQPRVDYGTGFGARGVGLADVDADGKLDVVVANSRVRVFTGNGNGTFGGVVGHPAGYGPRYVAVGDLDGDGLSDLAVANDPGAVVSVHLSNGDGTFGSARLPVTPDGGGGSAAAGDFNGDGRVDLAVGDSGVGILLGAGDGTFVGEGGPMCACHYNTRSLAASDLDGDGDLDLVVTNNSGGSVWVLGGRGDGAFDLVASYVVDADPQAIVVADVDTDGYSDIMTRNLNAPAGIGSVSVLLGNGDGAIAFASRIDYSTNGFGYSLAAGRLNGDAYLDLALNSGTDLWVLPGNGDGTFGTNTVYSNTVYSSAFSGSAIAIGDLNSDALGDIVAVNQATVHVFLGRSDGPPTASSNYTISGNYTLGSVALDDLNGDGRLDLAAADFAGPFEGGNTVVVIPGNGDGTFDVDGRTEYGVLSPKALVIAPMDADGLPDLALATYGSGVQVILGRLPTTDTAGSIGPGGTRLQRVFPNPSRGPVTIEAMLERLDRAATLSVYDIRGRLVWAQSLGLMGPGVVQVPWDGRGPGGISLPAAVYLVELRSSSRRSTAKLLLTR